MATAQASAADGFRDALNGRSPCNLHRYYAHNSCRARHEHLFYFGGFAYSRETWSETQSNPRSAVSAVTETGSAFGCRVDRPRQQPPQLAAFVGGERIEHRHIDPQLIGEFLPEPSALRRQREALDPSVGRMGLALD